MEVTVCTLTRNRTGHLVNQVRGLLNGVRPPKAHVVAVMGGEDPRPHLPSTPWPTKFVDVEGGGELPLARARNEAARHAPTGVLVMLDVDCIPSSSLVATYAQALDEFDGIVMGEVRYLPAGGAEPPWDDEVLHRRSDPHPVRPAPPPRGQLALTDAYALFWSLSFAVRRTTMLERIGGFDEGYGGYGAEDTDFAFRARQEEVPIAWVGGARAYHQHHETYDPPLQHLTSIADNARRFHEVWGRWPMEGWLSRFQEMGLISWDPDGDELVVRRHPTDHERQRAHRSTAVPAEDDSRA